jgi:hypothetical protein
MWCYRYSYDDLSVRLTSAVTFIMQLISAPQYVSRGKLNGPSTDSST